MRQNALQYMWQDNYKIYGKPVQDYWHKAESGMFSAMSKVIAQSAKINDKDARADYITLCCNDMQTKAFEDGKEMLNDVVWTQSQNSNALKIERNPETHQLTAKRLSFHRLKSTSMHQNMNAFLQHMPIELIYDLLENNNYDNG